MANSIIFYGWVTFIHTHTEHIFIHLSVDGHLGCFHILAILKNDAVNIGLNVSFQIIIIILYFSNIYPGVELLGHTVVLFLEFWEISILLSIVATPVYIPTNTVPVYKGLLFPSSSPAFICILFDGSHSDSCDVVSHCGLPCTSLSASLLAICISSWKTVYSVLLPIFKLGLFVFLMLSCRNHLYMLDINPISVISFASIFLLLSRLSFYLVNGFLCCANAFKFN